MGQTEEDLWAVKFKKIFFRCEGLPNKQFNERSMHPFVCKPV